MKLNDVRVIGMQLVKTACKMGCDDDDTNWTDQFKDSPFYGQSLALEAQYLKTMAQKDAEQAEEDAMKRQQELAGGGDRWTLERQFTGKKKEMLAQLLDWKAQMMGETAAPMDEASDPGMEEMAPGVPPLTEEELAAAEEQAAAEAQMGGGQEMQAPEGMPPAMPGAAGLGSLAQQTPQQ